MKSLIITLLLALSTMQDGHQLTSLWKQYQQAYQADQPKKEAEILDKIKKEATLKRLPVDFWDAATLYVSTVQRRDWKQRETLRQGLEKEVKEFNEPVVTFLWMADWSNAGSQELWKYIKENPLKGNNPALHRGTDGYLNGALVKFMDSDQEWAMWKLLNVKEAEEALANAVTGKYPQEAALRYILLNRKNLERANKKEALEELVKAYGGTAVSLYPEGDLMQMEMQDLEEAKANSAAFKEFYQKCCNFERRRAAFTQEEKVIASSYTTVENLVKGLTEQDLDISVDQENVTVLFRNLASASVKLYKDKTVVAEWNANNKENSFYVFDTLRLQKPVLPDGTYKLEAKSGKLLADTYYKQYTLSIATRTDADGRKVYVANYKTGKPLAKAQLLLMKGDTQVAAATMKLDGFTKLPAALDKIIKAHPKTYYYLVAVSGDQRSKEVGIIREAAVSIADNSVKCNIYMDRGAYNPGDTLQYKVVVFDGDPMLKMQVCAGKKLEVVLYDSEDNILETKSVKTGEWGSASGSFGIPKGLRNGMFSIEVKDGRKTLEKDYFRVDEFVLPTFDLSFDKRDQLYLVGSAVPVSGRVESYSGHGLSGARVRIRASRWGTPVFEHEAPLQADGLFRFEVPATEEGYYNAEVTVVDATGETLSFSDGFYAGKGIDVDIKVLGTEDADLSLASETNTWRWRWNPRYVVQGSEVKAVFQAKDANGNAVPLEVKWELDGKSGVTPSGKEVVIPISASGLYVLKATVRAELPSGEKVEDSTESKVLVLSPADVALNVPGARLFIAGPSTVKDKIVTKLGTAQGDAWVVTAVFGKDSQLLESGLQLVRDGRLQTITHKYKDTWPDAVRVQYYYFIDGRSVKYERQYRRERTKLTLPLQFTSFRDKAYPGTLYTFSLKTEPGVEALAAAWDKSMDAIRPNYWYAVTQADYSVPAVSIQASCGTVGDDSFADGISYPYYLSGTKTSLARNKSVEMMDAAAPVMAQEEMDVDYELVPMEGMEEDDVPVRSEFLQALTFQPHLLSGKDGSLSFSFRTSDKLSTYYVRVYAHDKSMRNAITEGEMVVSIPVKVALQEPRYLYEGDVWDALITVSSIADKPVSGILSLTWSGGSAQVPVTVPAGETVTKTFTVVASSPAPTGELAFTATFRAPEFSDAVRVTVPVLPASQTLTEAHSAVLRSGGDREALLSELRSRFVNVSGSEAALKEISVIDMVREAIPSHVEPAGNDVLSLSEAWYVRMIASKLGASDEGTAPGAEYYADAPGAVHQLDNNTKLLEKILACRNADGGFAWFEGMKSSAMITAVILERMAKLRDKGFDVPDLSSSVKYLDSVQFGDALPYWRGYLTMQQYMNVRAMYAYVPFTEKVSAQYKKEAKSYLTPSAKEGRGMQGQILSKARRLLTLKNLLERDGGVALAKAWGVTLAKSRMKSSMKADLASLLEYAVGHRDGGWYYPNAVMPWRGLLESEAYAHALLCDLMDSFAGAEGYTPSSAKKKADAPDGAYPSTSTISDGIRLWLMLQKETQKWDSDPAFVDAITSILNGSQAVLDTRVLSLSATYTLPFSEIKATGNGFTVERKFFRDGKEIHPGDSIAVGDKIRVVYKIWNGENRSFVKLTAGREAALNPVQQLSGIVGGWFNSGYRNVKAAATEYYFDSYPEENTELSEEFYVVRAGTFQVPAIVIESLYAPHYRANTGLEVPLCSKDNHATVASDNLNPVLL